MSASAMDSWLLRSRAEANSTLAFLDKLSVMREKDFPNMSIDVDQWKHCTFYDKEANGQVTKYDLGFSCSCGRCKDAPFEVRPYAERDGLRIYSDPPSIRIGQMDGIGVRPDRDWHARLLDAGIPRWVIQRLKKYFKENPPEPVRDDW